MKYTVLLTTALVAPLWLAACKQSTKPNETAPTYHITFAMTEDHLPYLRGDTVHVTGQVIVRSLSDIPVAGTTVAVWSSGAAENIEYLPPSEDSLTDQTGRLSFRLNAFPVHDQFTTSVCAQAGATVASQTVWYLNSGTEPGHLTITLTHNRLLLLPPASDSTSVTVTLMNSLYDPVPGVHPILHASGGVVASLPATDELGRSSVTWYTAATGHCTLTADYNSLHDSATIDVFSVSRVELFLDADTLRFPPRDTARISGSVRVFDGTGQPLFGAEPQVTPDGHTGWVEYPAALRNTTDSQGETHFNYAVSNVTQLTQSSLHAQCGGSTGSTSIMLKPVAAASVEVTATPDTALCDYWLPPHPSYCWDSVRVDAVVLDRTHTVIFGHFPLSLSVSVGHIAPSVVTGSDGRATAYWHPGTVVFPDGEYEVPEYVAAHASTFVDTARILLYPGGSGD